MTQSELSKYLETKSIEELLDLHEPLAKSIRTVTENQLPDWVDPSLLSKTDSYRVLRNYKLPKELLDIIHNNGWINKGSSTTLPKIRAYFSNSQNYIVMITPMSAYICFYMEPADSKDRFYTLDTHRLSTTDNTPPFFNVFDNLITAMAVSSSGLVYLWEDYTTKSCCTEYQIPLVSSRETITCVDFTYRERILLGSSTGELQLPSLSAIEKSLLSIDCIVSIHSTIENQLYILTDRSIQRWMMESSGGVKFLSDVNIENEVRSNIIELIPERVSKEGVRFKVLNMRVHNNDEIIIIVSYSIAGLGDYAQYALISFGLYQDRPLQVLYTLSIPYSAIPSTIKYKPHLSVLESIIFVTFDSTVIAVSTSKNSSFEEYVVLNGDEVLYTDAKSINDTARATIITLKSGILHFEVDTKLICAPPETGNIYGVIDDVVRKEELLFRSKLEQAIFFGARTEPLLQFFLRPERQVDISKVVMSLSDQIFEGRCKFLPFTDQTALYIESRYLFEKKIVSTLKENHLLNSVSIENKLKLMKRTEFYYLAQVLHKLSFARDSIMECWTDIIKSIVASQKITGVSYRSSFNDFIVNHTTKIVGFVRSYLDFLKLKENGDFNYIKISENVNIVLLRMVRKSTTFEEKYALLYNLAINPVDSISGQFRDMLLELFQINIACIQKHNINDMMESDYVEGIKKHTYDVASLLLQPFGESVEIESCKVDHTYSQLRKLVFEGLCKTGLYERAIELAEQYNDISAVVDSLNKSDLDPGTTKQRNIYFIELYKEKYFNCLLKYLDSLHPSDKQEEILDFCSLYPSFSESFFQQNELQISWIYYLKQKKYEKAAYSIRKRLGSTSLDERERKELIGWMKMINAALSSQS